jgi:hypothetical protein
MANDILITTESLKTILPVYEEKIVDRINSDKPKVIEPADDDLPKLFISGEFPTSKDYVHGELEYVSKSLRFHAYTLQKLQGTSTLMWDKKNIRIDMYQDEGRTIKLNKEFKNWGAHNNFVLKADYIDILHARNVVCAKLWSKVVASRPDYDSLPEELRNSPNNGAIDGFPVKVYVNGEYYGLCSLTIPKCAWMFGMNEKNENHVVLSAEMNDNGDATLEFNPCNFNAFWDGSDDYWDVEVGNLTDTVINSFNMINDGLNDDGVEGFLDIQSAIDYFVFQDIILGTDGLAKNMLLATYDMTKWYLSAYDLDSTFDMDWNGNLMDSFDTCIPDPPYNNQFSDLLWYIRNEYWDEYVARYWELRNSVLSEASIISAFEEYVGIYGEDVYIQDTITYPDIPCVTENTLYYLRNFVKNRLAFLDNEYTEVV